MYVAAADRLRAQGLLYPCFATRAEIEAANHAEGFDPDGAPLYPGLWRGRPKADVVQARAAGLPEALRIDMGRALAHAPMTLTFTELDADGGRRVIACDPARWGDVVLARKEVPSSYHLSVVVDDARQGVTHVTRGEDLFAATDLHRLLQILLGLPAPVYHHHRLMLGPDGRKLSKSAAARAIAELRAEGWSPAAVLEAAKAGVHFRVAQA
jgi:glutamyl-Q tRNA(Asp) synthetase